MRRRPADPVWGTFWPLFSPPATINDVQDRHSDPPLSSIDAHFHFGIFDVIVGEANPLSIYSPTLFPPFAEHFHPCGSDCRPYWSCAVPNLGRFNGLSLSLSPSPISSAQRMPNKARSIPYKVCCSTASGVTNSRSPSRIAGMMA